MIKREFQKLTSLVAKAVNARIALKTDQSNLYSRGLSREGYDGGYLECLYDITSVLNDVPPNASQHSELWKEAIARRKP
jgi:hypothetical protein